MKGGDVIIVQALRTLKAAGALDGYPPIAPTDGNLTIEEKWTLNKEELVIVGEKGTYGFKIIAVTKEKLILKQLSGK